MMSTIRHKKSLPYSSQLSARVFAATSCRVAPPATMPPRRRCYVCPGMRLFCCRHAFFVLPFDLMVVVRYVVDMPPSRVLRPPPSRPLSSPRQSPPAAWSSAAVG